MYYLWEESWHEHWRKRHWVYPAADFFFGGGTINASGIFWHSARPTGQPQEESKEILDGSHANQGNQRAHLNKDLPPLRHLWSGLVSGAESWAKTVHDLCRSRGGSPQRWSALLHMFPVGRGTANLSGCGYQCFTNKGQMPCDISSFLWSRGGNFIGK